MDNSSITFFCGEKDEPIEIQLEPECYIFKVLPGNEITFKGNALDREKEFKWSLCIDHNNKSIQLFPDCAGLFGYSIYENGILLPEDDWYKYMK